MAHPPPLESPRQVNPALLLHVDDQKETFTFLPRYLLRELRPGQDRLGMALLLGPCVSSCREVMGNSHFSEVLGSHPDTGGCNFDQTDAQMAMVRGCRPVRL